MRGLACLIACLLLPPCLGADQVDTGAGQSAAAWLAVQASPRPVAMAGAFTAVAADTDGLGVNPAGLSCLEFPQIDLAHNFWILDLAQDHIAYGQPILQHGALALSFDYFNLGSVESVSLSPGGSPVSQGYLHPYASDLSLGWGQQIMVGLSWGLDAKVLDENLGVGGDSQALAGDLGMQWRPQPRGLFLGLSLLNIGSQLQGASLPLGLHLGLGYDVSRPGRRIPLMLAADVSFNPGDSQSATGSVGEEYWVASLLALRAGYQFGSDEQPNGPTAGFGLRHKGLELDYAFDGRGRLASSQQLALKYDFGQLSVAEPVQPEMEEDEAGMAQDLHRLLDALDQGDTLTAQAQNDKLMNQVLPVRKQASEAMKEQAVQPEVFRGEFEEAEKSLQMMVKLDRSNAYNYQALGMVEWYLGRRELAVENLKKAYLLDPSRGYLLNKIKALGGSLPGAPGAKP
jgi:hypothetical protein